jgi:outer membrane lipoprotein-sorting protein
MSELKNQESEFSRLLQNVPFDDASGGEHCQSLREQVLAEFDRAATGEPVTIELARPWWKYALTQGKEIMRRPIPRLIAVTTACLAIAAVWMLVPGHQSSAQAFNKLATAVAEAKSAKFQMEVTIEGQPTQTVQAWFLAPGKYRQELPGAVNIVDLKAGKIMNVIASQKKVMFLNIKGEQKGQGSQDYFERLREVLAKSRDAKEEQYRPIGTKEIDGKQAIGFRFDLPAATVTLWGDAAGNPVRIESTWSGLPLTEVAMAHFEINVDVKDSMFDLTPPEGYKVQSIDVDASPVQESDLVAAFKMSSEMGDGQFPESLDTAGVMKLVIKFGMKHGGEKITDENQEKLMKQSIVMGCGFGFALQLPETADAHYAGRGIERDAKDSPIFWYKPEGETAYRVIFADLTVKDSATAPKVEGAQRLEKASKAKKPQAF